MSYYVSVEDVPQERLEQAINDRFAELYYPEPAPGVEEAVKEAATVAANLAAVLDQRRSADGYRVSISGHAAQDEEDNAGNFVNVSVNGMFAAPETSPAAGASPDE